MKTVESLVLDFKRLSPEDQAVAFAEYTLKALDSSAAYADSVEEAGLALGILTYAAIVADNRISDEELLLIYAGLKATLGDRVDLEACKKIASETLRNKDDIKEAAKELAENYLVLWHDDDKEDIVRLCIALCAIDGEISGKEINWLKDLVYASEA